MAGRTNSAPHSSMLRRSTAFAATFISLVVACPLTVRAQVSADADVTFAWPYVFRGEVVSTLPVIQPRLSFASHLSTFRVSAGVWSLVELLSPGARDFSLRDGQSAFAQWDVWGDVTATLLGQDVTAGATRYQFVHAPFDRVASSSQTELYATIERPATIPISEAWWYRARYWHSLGAARTRYAEIALGPQWFILPLPAHDISLSVTGAAGINLARARPSTPQLGAFTRQGITHWELDATVVAVPHCSDGREISPAELLVRLLQPRQLALKTQFGRDSLTRFVRRGRERARFSWLEVVFSPFQCERSR